MDANITPNEKYTVYAMSEEYNIEPEEFTASLLEENNIVLTASLIVMPLFAVATPGH